MENKVARIVKAKLSKKEDMPDWYTARLKECEVCPHNSKNRDDLTLKDKARIAHNLGKPSCLICTCGVEDKSSDALEQCPDSPPRWLAREVEKGLDLDLSLVKGSAELLYDKNLQSYILDYGDKRPFEDTKIEISYEANKGITGISMSTSCGCTTGVVEGKKLVIKYQNNRLGKIDKRVTIMYKKEGVQRATRIQLKGRIEHGL